MLRKKMFALQKKKNKQTLVIQIHRKKNKNKHYYISFLPTLQYPRQYTRKMQKGPSLQVEGVLFFGSKRNIAALREYFSKLTILEARRSFS